MILRLKMNTIKSRIKKAIKDHKTFKGSFVCDIATSYCLSLMIYRGYSKSIANNEFHLSKIKNPIVKFHVASSLFLCGDYNNAMLKLLDIIAKFPQHAESYYLLADIYLISGKKDKAKEILELLLTKSTRLKTWLQLANMVDTKNEFEDLLLLWNQEKLSGRLHPYHFEVNGYIATAALRAKQYAHSEKIWLDFIESIKNEKAFFPIKSDKTLSTQSAPEALRNLKVVLDNSGVEFFLISGTLLGCIRDNKLLGHDKDIDVGIWNDIDKESVITALSTSGLFHINSIRSEHVIRIKHVNGVAIDLFIHYREENNYWHGGVKLKWNNTPFQLKEKKFIGEKFKIPSNYDLYLRENYGDWKKTVKKFDSAFDTPNSTILNKNEMRAHAFKLLAVSMHRKDWEECDELLIKLESI